MVAKFHKTFDHPLKNKVDKEIFNNRSLVDLRVKLIEEELPELKIAIANIALKKIMNIKK